MHVFFSTESRHHVTEANVNYYKNPFMHPSRTMAEHDFIYILQGEWKFGQNGVCLPAKKDSLLILSAMEHHYGMEECTKGTKTMYFHVSREAGDRFSDLPEKRGEEIRTATLLDAGGMPKIKKYFSNIVAAKLAGKEREADIWFDLLLCTIGEAMESGERSDVAEQLKHIIHKNPEIFYSNEKLAEMVKVSVKTAENKFKAAFGLTLHQYILQFKMEEAVAYFKIFPELSVKEVAHNLGFYDEYHFAKQFKRLMNTSPGKYKKELSE